MGGNTTRDDSANEETVSASDTTPARTRNYRKGHVVLYSLDQGETYKVANDVDAEKIPVGWGEHSGHAKQLAREKVEELRVAIDEGKSPLVVSVPASSFQPKPAKLRPAAVVF